MLPTVALQDEINGRVISPDDPDYDGARAVFLGNVDDHRPQLIVRAADEADVARVIALARETGLELAVRSGGHGSAGHGTSDGGLVLDLSDLDSLEIDAAGRTAWAGAGLTTGAYTAAAAEHGLATPFGDTGTVGVGGITLAGGVGYLVRKHGLTIDDLLAADVVTADGELVRADAYSHPDLFWAIRGGGGNFGVVTRMKFRLHEVSTVVGGMLLLPAEPEVITSFVEAAEAAPEELSTIAAVMLAPPMPFVPAELHGKPIVLATMAYAGAVEDGERAVAPFREIATPLADMLRPMPYPEIFEGGPEGVRPRVAMRTMLTDHFNDDAARAIMEHVPKASPPMAVAQIRVLGGAMARVPADATAFAHRDRRLMISVATMYLDPAEQPAREAWVGGLAAELDAGDTGAYVGFLAADEQERVRSAYPGATWDRLTEIKARYDPDNVFRVNHNIPPA
ncbi:MAG TPA: FAD-binding oxidoreductase [Solirubrobacter sp.]|nr:FAD-binding oxidoreductase [Solirubrobacter sp.]